MLYCNNKLTSRLSFESVNRLYGLWMMDQENRIESRIQSIRSFSPFSLDGNDMQTTQHYKLKNRFELIFYNSYNH